MKKNMFGSAGVVQPVDNAILVHPAQLASLPPRVGDAEPFFFGQSMPTAGAERP